MRAPAAILCVIAACAQGTPGNPDAPRGAIDAPASRIDAPIGSADARVDAAPTFDARPDSMPTFDARPDAGVLGNGDTCATANDISGQTSFTFSGDLTGLANDIQPNPSCTGFDNDGPDAIFIVTANAGQTITASITTDWDSAIEITTTCALLANCVAGSDQSVSSPQTETTSYTAPTTGTYYVVVDSWDAAAFGPYQLVITIQ